MNREPSPFSDEDEPLEPAPQPKHKRRGPTSRAEVLGWFAAILLFAALAWLLLFPSVRLETRAMWSGACLLLGAAFFALAWRELR